MACITHESVDANRRWAARLQTPYALLSDEDGSGARALGVLRAVALGPWNLELVRRTTLLVDSSGNVAAVWGKVKIRGHALEVLKLATVAQAGASDRS